MPRMTVDARQARREALADAAVRAFAKKGVAHASMADVIDEARSSAGSVYAHFQGRADLARFTAGRVLDARAASLLPRADDRRDPMTPSEVLRAVLDWLADGSVPVPLVVQFWGEATVDPAMGGVVRETIRELEAVLALALRRWAQEQTSTSGDAERLEADAASTITAVAQGYMARIATVGPVEPDAYIASLQLIHR